MVSQTYTQAQLDAFLAAKATPAQISAAITALVNGASTALDTLGEIDAQLAADEGSAAALAVLVASKAGSVVPTSTKTSAYTAAIGEMAMMNVAAGGSVVTLPTTPPDRSLVGMRAIGATAALPLTVVRGGSADTIGTASATSAILLFADEVSILQFDAPNGRWLSVANVKPQTSLDARYSAAPLPATVSRSITNVMEPVGNSADGFGGRIRPVEQRRLLRIINTGANPIRIGYSSQTTNASFSATAYQYQLNVGQELVDTSGDPSAIYLSDVGHQLALSALVITETLS